MSEAKIVFKREGREGVIPVGTYLSDAAKRFGVLFEGKCVPVENVHFCKVTVAEGENALTAATSLESQYFADNPGDGPERLSCQVKIKDPEEIVIMTTEKEKQEEEKNGSAASGESYVKEFRDLPLEKKIAELVQLEAVTLGETVSFVINSPYLVFEKVMDVLAEFGMKKEENSKRDVRPAEHAAEAEQAAASSEDDKTEPGKTDEPDRE